MAKVLSVQALAASALTAAALLGSQAALGGGCGGSACYNLVESPPVYGTISESYVAYPAQRQSRVIPAEYDYVTEKVMIQPARKIAHHRHAQYDTVTEKVLVAPAGRRWEVSRDAYGNATGCWVDVPAQYAYQSRKVEVSPAYVDYETVPAVYTRAPAQGDGAPDPGGARAHSRRLRDAPAQGAGPARRAILGARRLLNFFLAYHVFHVDPFNHGQTTSHPGLAPGFFCVGLRWGCECERGSRRHLGAAREG